MWGNSSFASNMAQVGSAVEASEMKAPSRWQTAETAVTVHLWPLSVRALLSCCLLRSCNTRWYRFLGAPELTLEVPAAHVGVQVRRNNAQLFLHEFLLSLHL